MNSKLNTTTQRFARTADHRGYLYVERDRRMTAAELVNAIIGCILAVVALAVAVTHLF